MKKSSFGYQSVPPNSSSWGCGLKSPLQGAFVCGPVPVEEDPAYCSSNGSWWAAQTMCAIAEDVPEGNENSERERFYKFVGDHGDERHIRLTRLQLSGRPEMGSFENRVITAFTEVRQPYWTSQPSSWITYHAFTILELDDGACFLLCERKTDFLELVFGSVNIKFPFMKAFRAMGPGRNLARCVDQPRHPLGTRVTVRQLLGWLDGPVEENWKPYDLMSTNCQHFAAELQSFLVDPSTTYHRTEAAVQVPVQMYSNRTAVLTQIARNPRAIKHLPPRMRADKEIVMQAVSGDGNTIRYIGEALRTDMQVATTALLQNGYALLYVDPQIRQDRDLVLTAVRQSGVALCYASEEHRMDREIVMAAVRNDAYAFRFVEGKLRCDPAVLAAASWNNPWAVVRMGLFF